MDGLMNWEVRNVMDELVPLPPCLRLKEFDFDSSPNVDQAFGIGFDESQMSHMHAISDLHINPHESISSDQSFHQSTTINSSLAIGLMQTQSPMHGHDVDCTRNPNIRKRDHFFCNRNPYASRLKMPKVVVGSSMSFGPKTKTKSSWELELDEEATLMAEVKEMVYIQAALQPVINLELELEEEAVAAKPKRKNVKVSSDPQTVAARHRREKISERLRILQRLVPGGTKLDTASMLQEAANYVSFLQLLVRTLQTNYLHPTMN